jgi:hypothetical protein
MEVSFQAPDLDRAEAAAKLGADTSYVDKGCSSAARGHTNHSGFSVPAFAVSTPTTALISNL